MKEKMARDLDLYQSMFSGWPFVYRIEFGKENVTGELVTKESLCYGCRSLNQQHLLKGYTTEDAANYQVDIYVSFSGLLISVFPYLPWYLLPGFRKFERKKKKKGFAFIFWLQHADGWVSADVKFCRTFFFPLIYLIWWYRLLKSSPVVSYNVSVDQKI